ncbi:MAG: hypothetical protein ACRDRX_01390 [Pseudonocardiaceae bacterium]
MIYELHVGALNPAVTSAGTFADALNFIPHLLDLGVNAVELMPMFQFDGSLSWGYGSSHFLLEGLRWSTGAQLFRFHQDIIRFRLATPALRSRNIEIIHTDNAGRVLAFRRWENATEYLIAASLNNTAFDNPHYVLNHARAGQRRMAEVFQQRLGSIRWIQCRKRGCHATGRRGHPRAGHPRQRLRSAGADRLITNQSRLWACRVRLPPSISHRWAEASTHRRPPW